MTIDDLKNENAIIFECITGSRAYGLDLPTSDTDIKGVFILPKAKFYGFDYISQVNNESNDIVYYELKKFLELLHHNNPSMIELLHTPDEMILLQHPIFDKIKAINFLTKRCKHTFAGYAAQQIKKARGLNKKIVNPVGKKRKTILDFCTVLEGQGSVDLKKWLTRHQLKQEYCGLVNIAHAKGIYGLYYDDQQQLGYRGILKKDKATEVLLSSIPKGQLPRTHLYFNQDGFKKYCKDYRDYWDWVDKRNDERYENTLQHGKNYDSKNMMHTFRLLDMAAEILESGQVLVKRPNRAALLRIRKGEFSYEDLLEKAAAKLAEIEVLYEKTSLPADLDKGVVEELLFEMRAVWYKKG